jgi:integrase
MGRRPLPPKGLVAVSMKKAVDHCIREAAIEYGPDASIMKEKRSIMRRMLECLGERREVWTLTVADLKEARSYIITGEAPEGYEERSEGGPRQRKGRTTKPAKGSVTSTIRQFAKECRENLWLPGEVDLPRKTYQARKAHTGTPPPPTVFLEPEQFAEVLDAAERRHPRVRMAIALGIYAGRRISATLGLRVGHVDRRKGIIKFYERKTDEWIDIPISVEMAAEFARWWRWITALHGVPQEDWYLVPNRKSVEDLKGPGSRFPYLQNPATWPVNVREPTAYNRIWADVRVVLEQFGYEKHAGSGTHTFRRSGAVVIDNALGLPAAQAFLGHKSPVTTQIYTRNLAATNLLREQMTSRGLFSPPSGDAEVITLPIAEDEAG